MFKSASDLQFEKTFADLAYANLKDRSPRLLDFLIGFQVLDKDEDDTKGAGVFVFDIGGAPYYGPVFFLNGQLKGSQLLYSKKLNQFVPLQEKWVNYIINSMRPKMGGSSEGKVKGSYPDLTPFITPPGTNKVASEKVASFFGDILSTPLGKSEAVDLKNVITSLSKEAKVKLAKSMQADEKFAEAVMDFYDVNDLLKLASYERPKYKAPVKPAPKVEVILPNTKVAADLTKEEVGTMTRDGVVVRDFRDSTTTVFDGTKLGKDSEMITNRFMTPEPGMIASVLLADGTFRKSIIARDLRPGVSNKANCDDILVIPVDAKEQTIRTSMRNVFVPADEMPFAKDAFMQWLSDNQGGTENKSVKNDPENEIYSKDKGKQENSLVIDQSGNVIAIKEGLWKSNMKEGTSIEIGCFHAQRQPYLNSAYTGDGVQNSSYGGFKNMYSHVDDPQLAIVTNGTGIKVTSSTVYIPKYCVGITINNRGESSTALGNPNLLAYDTLASSDYQKVKITSDGIEYIITDKSGQKNPLSKSGAIIKLATEYGIHGEMASKMINMASGGYGVKQAKFLLKKSSFDEVDRTNYDSDLGVLSRHPETYSEEVYDLKAAPKSTDDEQEITSKARKAAIDAANTGNKEILDTAVLTGLLENSGATSIIDGYMKTLIASLDRVGRIMFLFYWHDDKFKERYGSQDIKSLEDSLITIFDSLGDLILFLKEKTADVDSLLTSGNLELDGSV